MMIYSFVFAHILLLMFILYVNKQISERYRQWYITVLSVFLYVSLLAIYLHIKDIFVIEFIDTFWQNISQSDYYQLFNEKILKPFFDTTREYFNIGFSPVLGISLVIVFLFAILKAALLLFGFFGSILRRGVSIPLFSSPFFTADEKSVYIKPQFIFLGKVSKYFGILLFFSSLPVLLIHQNDSIIWPAYLPVIALLFLEIGLFLQGKEKGIQSFRIFIEDESSGIIVKLNNLYDAYKEKFSDKLMADSKVTFETKPEGIYNVSDPYLKYVYEDFRNNQIEISNDYFKGFDYLFMGLRKNILFSDAHDKRYGLYFKVFLDYTYLLNERVLVIVLDEIEKEKTLSWMQSLLSEEIYLVSSGSEFEFKSRSNHILIDTLDELLQRDQLISHYSEFRYVVVLDMKNFIRKNHLYLNTFLNSYRAQTGLFPKILAFSNVSSDQETSINTIILNGSHSTEEIQVHHNDTESLFTLVFEAEEASSYQNLVGINIGDPIGSEVSLAYFAWSRGIKPIIVSSENSSLEEDMENLKNSTSLDTFTNNDMPILSSRYFYPVSIENKVFVIEDTGNLQQTIMKWKNFSISRDILLAIVSLPYLLRNYMVDNIKLLTKRDLHWYNEIFPTGEFSNKEKAFFLLARLSSTNVERGALHIIHPSLKSKMDIAKYINTHLEIKIEPSLISVSHKNIFRNKTFSEEIYYSIPKRYFYPSMLYYRFIDSHSHQIGICMEGDIYHKYIEGMNIVLEGKGYEILSIDHNRREVVLKFVYTGDLPIYDIRKKIEIIGDCSDNDMSLYVRNMSIGSIRYWAEYRECSYVCNILDYCERSNCQKVHNITSPALEYTNKNILVLRYETPFTVSDSMRLAFEYLLNGIFETLFPKTFHLLTARAVTLKERDIFKSNSIKSGENELVLCLFETSRLDYHLLSTIVESGYYRRILELIQDYILWSIEKGKPLSAANSFVDLDNMDFNALSEFIDILLSGRNEITNNRLKKNNTGAPAEILHVCDFCADTLPPDQLERLEDGRERCEKCRRSSVDALGKNYKELVNDAIDYLEKTYRIKIDQDLTVKIVNSKTLHEEMNIEFHPTSGFDNRAVGLAVSSGDEKSILIENAAPLFRVMATIVHELTHIWQFHSLDMDDMDIVKIEGHAQWVELTYIEDKFPGEKSFVEREKNRSDEYGKGYHYVELVLENRGGFSTDGIFDSTSMGNPFDAYRDMFGKD